MWLPLNLRAQETSITGFTEPYFDAMLGISAIGRVAKIHLPEGTTVTGDPRHFEFSTRGSVHEVDGSGATVDVAGDVVLTITRDGWSYTVTINALGRIKLD